LTIASFGGAFTRSQMIAYVQPYRELKNRWVSVEDYDGGLDEIRDQVLSANVTWDLVSMELPHAIAGCDEGLLESIDHGILPPALDGTPAVRLPISSTWTGSPADAACRRGPWSIWSGR
jgi:putative spermidine/putrescine transport system substrate-binding protein